MTSGRARPSAIFERADRQICFRKWHTIYTFNSLAFNYFKSRILPKARFLSDMAAGASPKRTNKRFEPGVDSAPPVSSLSLFCADKFSAINLVVERDAGHFWRRDQTKRIIRGDGHPVFVFSRSCCTEIDLLFPASVFFYSEFPSFFQISATCE